MGRHLVVGCLLLAACGGGNKKQADKPIAKQSAKPDKPIPPPETEADRDKKRHALAVAIVPEGSSCLPVALKDDNAPRLEVAAVGKDAKVCAIDTDRTRLLGPIACWKLDLKSGAIAYQEPAPLPGRGIDVMIDDRCARGFCVPKDAKLGASKVAHVAWNLEGTKIAVLVGDDVHMFDTANKAHLSSFTIRGDKGVSNDPVSVHFVGETIFVEGADQGPYSAVWVFKTDGTQVGPITAIGAKDDKPMSTYHGSFSILDGNRVAIAERGYETVTLYEIDSGKRTKLVRKLAKPTCKPDEIDAFWHDGDKVTDRCKDSMNKLYGHLMGATTIAGATSLLALLRNDRLGELSVLDPKSLVEKRALKMPWCDANKSDKGGTADKDDSAAPPDKKKDGTRGPKAKAKSSDPEEGGQ
jgi:hypothetical protein